MDLVKSLRSRLRRRKLPKTKMQFYAFKIAGWALVAIPLGGIILMVSLFWGAVENYSKGLASGLLNFLSILVGVGATFLSIYYTSGEWYSVFKRFSDLGIQDGNPTRKGRETAHTAMWLDEIKKANRSLLFAGVTLAGWFVVAWNDLSAALPEILDRVNSFEIFLLNPLSESFRVREEDERCGGETEDPTERIIAVLTHLKKSMDSRELKTYWDKKKIQVYLYQGTPFSIVQIDDIMYSVNYLPCVSDRECPQLKLTADGVFSAQIKQAIERLRGSKSTLHLENPKEIADIIKKLTSRSAQT